MKPNDQNPSFSNQYEAFLAEALRSRGWQVHSPPQDSADAGFDLVAEQGNHRYVIELKVARDSRREALQSLLADSILRARSAASRLHANALAVVAAPQISESMAEALQNYVQAFAPGQAFGYVDGRGLVQFIGEGLQDDWRDVLQDRLLRSDRVASWSTLHRLDDQLRIQRPRNPFSDSNQWMLKVLLGQGLSPEYISVPKARVDSPSSLAKAAAVSLPSAWRFVQAFSEEGFLERRPRGLHLVRIRELLERWRAASLSSPRQVPMSWALRSGKSLDQLKNAFGQPQFANTAMREVCVGLFSACDLLGLGLVRGAPVHLYVRQYDVSFLRGLGLVPAVAGKPVDVFARVPRWRESVFRARVRRDGAWAADVIQCWLDVSHEPSRGSEQADFLWRRVIARGLGIEGEGP